MRNSFNLELLSGDVVLRFYSIFSSDGHFVKWSRATCAVSDAAIMGYICVKS